ncbi:tryptophan synthase subunit alpha [Heliobacterium chlorum]|uniref:Tryptophan synthase alpha chain n=1 Tax=Heliobacterium chlorum TaxID=2698 RepID=A0ABR7T0N2_HELCL|nr:tryptophan synthase subunit alpha [Heliobacterium chlorum]MBC9783126.1 tryptophan synthase subunit alpha [Heliobacterium chlorum]
MSTRHGTERIEHTFQQLKAEGRTAFIPYITAGDPDLNTTAELVLALEASGASIIELGVPFSDPVADGPVIQEAACRALAGGVTLMKVLKMVEELRNRSQVPIVLMTYYNLLMRMGLKRFAQEALVAGVDGVIIADLPVEEGDELRSYLDEVGIALIPLVAPTTPPERIQLIAEKARGFIYCVSLLGVTGDRTELPPDVDLLLNRVRKQTDLPLGLGFGISTPAHAASVAPKADGVIVGSAIVKRIAQHHDNKDQAIAEVRQFTKEITAALA